MKMHRIFDNALDVITSLSSRRCMYYIKRWNFPEDNKIRFFFFFFLETTIENCSSEYELHRGTVNVAVWCWNPWNCETKLISWHIIQEENNSAYLQRLIDFGSSSAQRLSLYHNDCKIHKFDRVMIFLPTLPFYYYISYLLYFWLVTV